MIMGKKSNADEHYKQNTSISIKIVEKSKKEKQNSITINYVDCNYEGGKKTRKQLVLLIFTK